MTAISLKHGNHWKHTKALALVKHLSFPQTDTLDIVSTPMCCLLLKLDMPNLIRKHLDPVLSTLLLRYVTTGRHPVLFFWGFYGCCSCHFHTVIPVVTVRLVAIHWNFSTTIEMIPMKTLD